MNLDQTISVQTVNGCAVLPSALRHADQPPALTCNVSPALQAMSAPGI
jgi:hypothetical protein